MPQARQVALIELSFELFTELINQSAHDTSRFVTYVCKVEEVDVDPELQAFNGPPRVLLYGALPNFRLLEIRSSQYEGQASLLVTSPALRHVPAGFKIPKILLTYRKERTDVKVCSSSSI